MKKYLFIVLLVGVWSCGDDNSDNDQDIYITLALDNVECVEIVQTNDSGISWVDCDYLQLSIPFDSNGKTPKVSYAPGIEPYVWSPLPFTDCIEDPESDGIYDDSDGCWNITFSYSYTNDSLILKWQNDELDMTWETYSYLGINNNFWNSIYKIDK